MIEQRAIQEMRRNPDKNGTFCNIWLFDNFAAKSPHDSNPYSRFSAEQWRSNFENAMAIAQDLIPKGVRTPKVYGVYSLPTGRPFLVMDKLPELRVYSMLPPQEMAEFLESFMRQRRIILDSGYVMGDCDFQAENINCGFNRQDREAWFYDLDFWKRKINP